MKKDMWKGTWTRGPALPGGNQGHTFAAKRSDDSNDEFNYVLKILKRQDDAIRRRRMYREVASLETLEHPGIASLEDSNAASFRDDVELYFVMQRIKGVDLEQFANDFTIDLTVAANMIIKVLAVLKFCHEQGVIHRDIKPCHVILRQGDPSDPVLIDFGLAFNEKTDCEFETESDQGVGNRFMILPEQMVPGDAKRDPRSDITQTLGIFFFLLTKARPGLINTPDYSKPHQRVSVRRFLPNMESRQYDRLQRIFDVGFEYDPDRRWQSIDSLARELECLLSSAVECLDVPFAERLAELSKRVSEAPATKRALRVVGLFHALDRAYQLAVAAIQSQMGKFVSIRHGSSGDQNEARYQVILHRQVALTQGNPDTVSEIIGRALPTEFVVGIKDAESGLRERARIGLFDPMAEQEIERAVHGILAEELSKFLATDMPDARP